MNPLLFGGATAAKKYPGGRNYHGNDWEATRYFSNYAELPNPVTYGGITFPSVEQAYVAAKFNDPAMSKFIAEVAPGVDYHGNRSMPAQVARNLGRAKPHYAARDWAAAGFTGEVKPLRPDWEDVKVDVMRDLVRQKFENNPEFAKALLATGDQELIEHTTGWGDRVWGMVDPQANRVGRDADPSRLEGENYLGRILMEQRGLMGGPGLVGRFAPDAMYARRQGLTVHDYRQRVPGEVAAAVAMPFEIVASRGPDVSYDVLGMRQGGATMATVSAPFEPGWLGNPYVANDAGGTMSREQATAAFGALVREKAQDAAWREAFLSLKGKRVGYYKPEEPAIHLHELQRWINEQDGGVPPVPEQPAAAMKPTGQQTPDAEQLRVQADPQRKAGDLLPWLLAAGGGGLLGYGASQLMEGDQQSW